jgi:Domain of unknown function (DUF4253)
VHPRRPPAAVAEFWTLDGSTHHTQQTYGKQIRKRHVCASCRGGDQRRQLRHQHRGHHRSPEKVAEDLFFTISDVDYNQVTLNFSALPKDLDSFIKDAVEFCPDLIMDDEDAEIPVLKKQLAESKKLGLWWD